MIYEVKLKETMGVVFQELVKPPPSRTSSSAA